MLRDVFIEVFERDLNKLAEEINLYSAEKDIWTVKNNISNSAGTLTLHLIGNLNHFIGAILGKNGYLRNRDAEFTLRNVPRSELLSGIENAIVVVKNTLSKLTPSDFEKDFPIAKHDKIVKTDFMLMHLVTHFNYHLGQVNYHRRLCY